MALGDRLNRVRDRVSSAVSNFFYPRDEYPEERQTQRNAGQEAEYAPQIDPAVNSAAFRQVQRQETWQMPLDTRYAGRGFAPQNAPAAQPQPYQAEAVYAAQQQEPRAVQQPMPPVMSAGGEQKDNLVYFPGPDEDKTTREGDASVRVINARSVQDCYSAITQLRQGDEVILVMDSIQDPAEMRHYVDMLSGACYSLRATITKLSRHGAYLICPGSMRVFVDRATNQLNSPARSVNRPNPQMMTRGQAAGTPQQAVPSYGAYDPYAMPQPGWANGWQNPNAYQARGEADGAQQPYGGGYAPEPGREAIG